MRALHVVAHRYDEEALEVLDHLHAGEHVGQRDVAHLDCEGSLQVALHLPTVGKLAEVACQTQGWVSNERIPHLLTRTLTLAHKHTCRGLLCWVDHDHAALSDGVHHCEDGQEDLRVADDLRGLLHLH